MKFSIIVPVYNAEKYLNQCIDSVIGQSFDDWQMILVDDGSTDSSAQICDSYCKKDGRITAFHRKNAGASAARNTGLDNAEGDYVIFLDSDDYYSGSQALLHLSQCIDNHNNCDIAVFGCTDFNMKTQKCIVSRNGYDTKLIDSSPYSDALRYFLSNKMIPGGPTIFAAKRSLIENNSVRFKTGIQSEDHDFVLSVFYFAKSVCALNEPFYVYRQHEGSVTGNADIKAIKGICYTVDKWFDIFKDIKDETVKADFLNYLAFIYTTGFVISGRLKSPDRKNALKIMNERKFILNYGYWKKTKIIKASSKILGFGLFSVLSNVYFGITHIQN